MTIYSVIASDNIRASDDAQDTNFNTIYVLKASIIIPENIIGTVRITYDLRTSYSSCDAYGIVRKNGVDITTQRNTFNTSFDTMSEDISIDWNSGDIIQLYTHKCGPAVGGSAISRYFRLKYDIVGEIIQTSLTKYLTYKVNTTRPAKTKQLQYRVLNSPKSTISNDLRYILLLARTDLTKPSQYRILAPHLKQKLLRYVIESFPRAPYIIYGRVKKNNIELPNITVNIENLTRGGSDTRITDTLGYYLYDDLSQLPSGYDEGDTIKVGITYPDNFSINFVTLFEPEEKLIDLNYFKSFNMLTYLDGNVGLMHVKADSPNMTSLIMLNGQVGIMKTHARIG